MIGSYPADEKMSLKILHDANFRRLKQVNFDIKSCGKLGMVMSCHPEMGSELLKLIQLVEPKTQG